MACQLRRIRFRTRYWPDRTGITTTEGRTGRALGTAIMSHRPANPRQMSRSHHPATFITPMMFPGIGHIDIRRP